MTRFSELLQLVTTSKDYAFSVLHTSRITIGRIRSSQPDTVFTSRRLVAASNGGRFPNCPQFQLLSSHSSSSQQPNPNGHLTHQPTIDSWLTAKASWPCFITSLHGPVRKHSSSAALQLFRGNIFFAEPLLSNGCCIVISRSLLTTGYATVLKLCQAGRVRMSTVLDSRLQRRLDVSFVLYAFLSFAGYFALSVVEHRLIGCHLLAILTCNLLFKDLKVLNFKISSTSLVFVHHMFRPTLVIFRRL
jgi:hypothetical protein